MTWTIKRASPNQEEQPQQEEWGSYINRNLITPAVRSVAGQTAGPISGQNYGEQLAERFVPGIVEKTGGAPKGLASTEAPDIIPGTLSALAVPFAGAVKAGNKATQVAKSLAGSLIGGEALAGTAQALGAPEKIQQAAGIAGSALGGGYARQFGLKKPSTVLSRQAFEKTKTERPKRIAQLEKKQSQLYKKTEQGFKDLNVDATPLVSALDRIEAQVPNGVDLADQKRILETTEQLKNLASENKINVQKAVEFVQRRNKAVYDQNMPPNVKQFNKEIISETNKFIDEVGKKNPKLGKAYTEAKKATIELKELQKEHKAQDKLTYAQYQKQLANKTLGEWIGEGVKFAKGEILPATISAIAAYFGGKQAAGITTGAIRAGKFLKGEYSNIKTILKENPGLGKDFLKLEKAAASQDKALASSVINRINDRFKKQEKENLVQGEWKITRAS